MLVPEAVIVTVPGADMVASLPIKLETCAVALAVMFDPSPVAPETALAVPPACAPLAVCCTALTEMAPPVEATCEPLSMKATTVGAKVALASDTPTANPAT